MPVKLSARDKKFLNGGCGEAAEIAMRIVVRMADVLGADELMDVSQAHIDGCGLLSEASLDFAEMLARKGGKVCIPTTLNMGPLDLQKWEDFGIDIKVVGIRQLGISEDATKQVFERMKADRQRKTAKIINDGTTEAGKIKEDAELKRKELLAIVEAEAKAIRGRGDADAAQYYKMLDENPELAMFLRDIEALRKILEDKTTIVIGAETDPIGLLKEAPDIKPTN